MSDCPECKKHLQELKEAHDLINELHDENLALRHGVCMACGELLTKEDRAVSEHGGSGEMCMVCFLRFKSVNGMVMQ